MKSECFAAFPTDSSAILDRQVGIENNPTLRINLNVVGWTGDQFRLVAAGIEERMPPNLIFDLDRTVATGAKKAIPGIPVEEYVETNFAYEEIGIAIINCVGKPFTTIDVKEVE